MKSGEADISDVISTMNEAIASVLLYSFGELVRNGIITTGQASERMREVAAHMRSPEHKAPIVGEAIALKIDQHASVLESAGTEFN